MPETHGLFLWLINTLMKIAEVTNSLKTYIATVRVNGAAIKTSIQADSSNAARMLLLRLYGQGNVASVTAAGSELAEAGAGQVMDAGEQQVKALADQARRIVQQKRQLQARQGMAKAQERMRQASKQTN
jgi:anionic cell wall polymer biosynthesis LytR-Cps2A-Psr (LCP) family protein